MPAAVLPRAAGRSVAVEAAVIFLIEKTLLFAALRPVVAFMPGAAAAVMVIAEDNY